MIKIYLKALSRCNKLNHSTAYIEWLLKNFWKFPQGKPVFMQMAWKQVIL